MAGPDDPARVTADSHPALDARPGVGERDRDAHVRAALLRFILWVCVAVGGISAVVFPFFYAHWFFPLIMNGALVVAALYLLRRLERGALEWVANATSGVLIANVVASFMATGGVRSPAVLAAPAVIFIIGFVKSARAALVTTTLFVVSLLAVGIAESMGFSSPVDSPLSTAERWLSLTGGFFGTGFATYAAIRSLRSALGSAEHNERRYAMLVDQNPDGIVELDENGRIVDANAAARALLSATGDEIFGRALDELPGLPEGSRRMLASTLGDGANTEVSTLEFELDRHRDDGELVVADTTIYLRAHLTPLMQAGEARGTLLVLRDETDRVDAERSREELRAALAQTQKMQVVGQLAGGVAHDFNNYLTVIRTCTDALQMRPGHAPENIVNAISEATDRSAQLTRQLLAFSRKQVLEPRLVDLNQVLERADPMVQRVVRDGIEIVAHRNDEPVYVMADPAQLEVALLNLVVNARDAMPDGGRVEIEAGISAITPEQTLKQPKLSGPLAASLSVRDAGHGMAADTLARACEPFFSTKGAGGTGLGLSSVYGIVDQSDGALEIDSHPGRGTTVSMLFPLQEQTEIERESLAPSSVAGGTERILVVEDQELLRDVTREMLQSAGYEVVAVESAEDALSLFDRDETFALVLSDVMLPGMDGFDLRDTLRERYPYQRVQLMTGYSARDDHPLEPHERVLKKPFTARALLRRVRAHLDELATLH